MITFILREMKSRHMTFKWKWPTAKVCMELDTSKFVNGNDRLILEVKFHYTSRDVSPYAC